MRTPKLQITWGDLSLVVVWAGVAGTALSWISGGEGVPVTIWWIVFAIASCGIIAALLGYGGIYNLLAVILFCAAIITMEHWLWFLIPSR